MATFVPIRGTQAQINATPIVDGQMLIETDQGNFNKIYLDVNTTRYQVGGHSGGSGSSFVLTTTETSLYGKSVTITIDGTTYTDTFNSSGTVVINDVVKVGTAVVTSTDGSQTATSTLLVPYYGLYTVNLSFFNATITVTFPYSVGALCTLSDGTTTIPATSSPMIFNVNHTGTWRANVTLDGASKYVDTVITTDGQTETVDIEYGTINLTFADDFRGQSITCTKGSTVITKSAPSSGNSMRFFPPTTGTWTIASTVSGQTYSKTVDVDDLNVPVPAELVVRPNGSTVTPVNDVSIWLECASIDKPYTTLEEVLSDEVTLAKLISEPNAVDYMVRSTDWIGDPEIGLVPTLTSDTVTTNGQPICSSAASGYEAWKAFNLSESNGWITATSNPNISVGNWVGYEFANSVNVGKAVFMNMYNTNTATTISGQFQAYDDDISDWTNVSEIFTYTGQEDDSPSIIIINTKGKKYTKYRWICTTTPSSVYMGGLKLQFYPIDGIINDETAMRYIGKRNYCANTLIADSDWCDGLLQSNYRLSVFTDTVPLMTSDTTPSGTCFGDYTPYSQSGSPQYKSYYAAFDRKNDFRIGATATNSASTLTDSIGYHYTTPTVVTMAEIICCIGAGDLLTTLTLQGSNDNSNWDDLGSNTFNPFSGTQGYVFGCNKVIIKTNNTTSYEYYRISRVSTVVSGSYNARFWYLEIYFVKRDNYDESVIDIYSAAQDSVYYMNGVNQVSIGGTTDSNGHTTVARNNLPINGEYTLYSTVAKNPLNTSSAYSRRIKIFDEIIDIMVRPKNAVYWYGCKDNVDGLPNGYTYSNFNLSSGTFNNQYISNGQPSSASWIGVGSTYPISKINVYNAIETALSLNTDNMGTLINMCSNKTSRGDQNNNGLMNDAGYNNLNVAVYLQAKSDANYKDYRYMLANSVNTSKGALSNNIHALWADTLNQVPTFISAANDTLYLLDGSNNQIPIARTNARGYSYDLMLENGTYDIYSSVAKDPSDLSKPFCLRNFVVDNNTVQIKVMPENTLYWWGYINSNCESVTSANGWTSRSTLLDPVYNVQNVALHHDAVNQKGAGIGNKTAISSANKVVGIMQGISQSSNIYGYIVITNPTSSKTLSDTSQPFTAQVVVDTNVMAKYEIDTSSYTNFYFAEYTESVRSMTAFALWLE